MISGNYENKYQEKFIISRLIVNFFLNDLKELFPKGKIRKIAEVGAGEGYITKIIGKNYKNSQIISSDSSLKIIEIAKKNNQFQNVKFEIQDVEDTSYKSNYFDLVVCIEVLEHVNNPQKALDEIYRISKKYLLISVPREPMWRFFNILRGKYLFSLGNTPGHLNHWSLRSFKKLLTNSGYKIIKIKTPLPWMIFLVEKKYNS